MPISKTVARWNKAGLNRVTRHIAPWLPGFGVLTHRGRKSGRVFSTPINVFRREGGFVVALTYGKDADWVRNVLAAGDCELVTRRRSAHLVNPRIVHDETRHAVPFPPRPILKLIKAYDFLLLDLG